MREHRVRWPLPVLALVCGILLVAAVPTARAATRLVDDNKAQCPTAGFKTIQAAVNAAAPGDVLLVCTGVYRETVTIGAGKNGVKLRARGRPMIKAPVNHAGAIVTVRDNSNVEVSGFRVAGPFTGPNRRGCPTVAAGTPFGYGLDVRRTTGTLIARNDIAAIAERSGGTACFFQGIGVLLTDARAIVRENRVGYASIGILAEGTRSTVSILLNTVAADPVAENAQYASQIGVLIAYAARGIVSGNVVTGNVGIHDAPWLDAYGIGVVKTSGVTVANNQVFDNDRGILIGWVNVYETFSVMVKANTVFDNEFQGIWVFDGAHDNTFDRNDARSNGGLDCQDDTHGGPPDSPWFTTRNKWMSNRGMEATPAQVCSFNVLG